MARYTNLFKACGSTQDLRRSLVGILESCGLNLIYETRSYLVAKEQPGYVDSYAQLATVEVSIDYSEQQETTTCVNLIVKNEELPLQIDNHCQHIFEIVNQAIALNEGWQTA